MDTRREEALTAISSVQFITTLCLSISIYVYGQVLRRSMLSQRPFALEWLIQVALALSRILPDAEEAFRTKESAAARC